MHPYWSATLAVKLCIRTTAPKARPVVTRHEEDDGLPSQALPVPFHESYGLQGCPMRLKLWPSRPQVLGHGPGGVLFAPIPGTRHPAP